MSGQLIKSLTGHVYSFHMATLLYLIQLHHLLLARYMRVQQQPSINVTLRYCMTDIARFQTGQGRAVLISFFRCPDPSLKLANCKFKFSSN
jgi:hypothetical protein